MKTPHFPEARDTRYATAPGAVYNAPGVLGVFTRGLRQAAAANERSQVQLRNPGGSAVLVIVEQVLASVLTAQPVDSGRLGAALATTPTLGARDETALSGSRAIVATGTDATGVITGVTTHRLPASETKELIGTRDRKLYPGDDLTVECLTDNIALDVTFRWREVSLDLVPHSGPGADQAAR